MAQRNGITASARETSSAPSTSPLGRYWIAVKLRGLQFEPVEGTQGQQWLDCIYHRTVDRDTLIARYKLAVFGDVSQPIALDWEVVSNG